jgi:hypothetical protein
MQAELLLRWSGGEDAAGSRVLSQGFVKRSKRFEKAFSRSNL